jgi:hypothetical protein
MRKDMIYDLRILFLETYVRVTMIGYESKQNRSALKAGLPSMRFLQGKSRNE